MFTQDLDEDDVADLVKEQAAAQTPSQAPPQKPKAKAPPAPKVPFGNYKDKHIDDPAVPLAELEYLAGSTARGLDEPKRAKFKAQNQAFLVALDSEIARRTNGAAPGGAQSQAPGSYMDDGAWADLILKAEGDWQVEYLLANAAFQVQSGHDIPKDQRWKYFEHLNILVEKSKK
jgi:hypothetical protein